MDGYNLICSNGREAQQEYLRSYTFNPRYKERYHEN